MSDRKWSPLREHLAEFTMCETGLSRSASRSFVSGFFRVMAEYIRSNDSTEIRGLGAFRWVTCRKRKCVNGGLFGKRTIPSYQKIVFHSKSIRRDK